jgi:hypothetical protein
MPSITLPEISPKHLQDPTIKAAIEAFDMASLGRCCIEELRAMLRGIAAISIGNEVVHDLAKLGVRFSDDLHNTMDCEAEEKQAKLTALIEEFNHA